MRTIEATLGTDGQVKLKEKVALRHSTRVLVTFLDDPDADNDAAILAEASLASGWIGPEADEAWKHLDELPDLDEVV
ncbi:MAG TPA: hypothetical protein VFE47_23060 [Tepidisphaeraceae bacterium]|jgi:hypothetical protein|nr:hypothetical protein [Tepidisphaeraceae bacterium]